jgi:hypothetical protein
MNEELDRNHAGHLPGHAIERPQRDRHAEHEQCGRSRGVLQEDHRAVERDRQLDMQRRNDRTEANRHDQRVEQDVFHDHAEGMHDRGMIAIGQLDQERHMMTKSNAGSDT